MICFTECEETRVSAGLNLLPGLSPKPVLTSYANKVMTLTLFTGKPSVRISWVMRANWKGEGNAQGCCWWISPRRRLPPRLFHLGPPGSLPISLPLTPRFRGLWILNLNGPVLPLTTLRPKNHCVLLCDMGGRKFGQVINNKYPFLPEGKYLFKNTPSRLWSIQTFRKII